jgi:hypothetical protein
LADGSAVSGRVVSVQTDYVVVESNPGVETRVDRRRISSVATQSPEPRAAVARDSAAGDSRALATSGNAEAREAAATTVRDVTIPAGTLLPLALDTSVASDRSRVEDPVRAHVTLALVVRSTTVVPAGSEVLGHVAAVQRSGRVKGRAHIALRFDTLVAHGTRYQIRTGGVGRTAPSTKKKDAMEIAVPAAGGAVLGGIIGGKKGAAIGGSAGGGAGTAYVLSTRGKEVRLPRGARLTLRLADPLTVRMKE